MVFMVRSIWWVIWSFCKQCEKSHFVFTLEFIVCVKIIDVWVIDENTQKEIALNSIVFTKGVYGTKMKFNKLSKQKI